MQTLKGHILHIPRWYPGLNGPQGGIFIYKHIAASKNFQHSVINVNSSKGKDIPLKKVLVERSGNITTYSYFYHSQNKILSLFFYCLGIYKCSGKVLKQKPKPDIIHAHVLLRTYVVAFILHTILRIPYIITEHWSGYRYGLYLKKSTLYRYLLKFTLKKAERVLVVSNRLKIDVLKYILLNKSKFEIVPNIAERTSIKKKSRHFPIIKILTVADLKDNIKRVSDVINVIKELDNKKVEYHIIGDGPDLMVLKQLASEKPDSRIIFHGELSNDEVLKQLPEYDFLIQNSKYETFGLVPLEALLSGLPVISTNTGCPEEIQVNEAGIFINPDQQGELKEAIVKMTDTFSEYNLKPIQEKINGLYSFEKVREKQEQIYDGLLRK